MSKFFLNTSQNIFEQATTLASYYDHNVRFNKSDTKHQQLLNDCSKELKTKLRILQEIDKKAVIGFTIGTACFGLSWLLPLAAVATIGFAYGAYQLGLRERAQMEFHNSLANLIECCKWTLGTVTEKAVINEPNIKDMIITLAPLVSEAELRQFIDDKYEDIFIKDANDTKQKLSVMNYELNVQETTLYYKIYGHKQGGFLAIIQGLGYAISNACQATVSMCTTSKS